MAVNCDPSSLGQVAACFKCPGASTNIEIQTYLLAVIAGTTTDPSQLQNLARSFNGLPISTLLEIQTFLLCQITNK